ncbi:MAG: LacI family transcriptional regulator, partial [Firmicutes bacterium]|nr:LacI family transcriptional regulator [Bacillota bacterium]
MKKLLAILLALAMVFSMAACTSGGGGTEPAPADGGDEPATTGGVVYEDGFPENVLRITYQAEPES